MTVQANPVLRVVVLPSADAHPQETPTRRLLNELGHDVTRATSVENALELMLGSDPLDLLVIDIANSAENRALVSRIAELPALQMPREVAVFTDKSDPQLQELRKQIKPSHMHVFLKPLHVHGLLSVLRQMERKAKQ